jgi:hypothetical protein
VSAVSLDRRLASESFRPIKTNPISQLMKVAMIAVFAALFAASCCQSSAPAPSKPTYVTPTK